MSQLDTLGRHVRQNIKIRGRDYFARNAVQILFADPDFVSAKVAGSKVYEVDLEREGKELIFACDCPYFEQYQEVCKHVWATLLELEKAGHFKQWEPAFPSTLIPTDSGGSPEDEYLDEVDFEDDLSDIFAPMQRERADDQQPEPASSLSAWHLLLKKMNRADIPAGVTPSWPLGREIIYVLEYARYAFGTSLSIQLNVRDPKKSGEWKKQKPLVLPHPLISCRSRSGEPPRRSSSRTVEL
jgi:hypothetical protein